MDFSTVEIESKAPPTTGRTRVDYTHLLDAVRAANGEWQCVRGTSAMNNYRTAISNGEIDGVNVGDFEAKVICVTKSDREAGIAGVYDLYVRVPDAERAAVLIAKHEARNDKAGDAPATDDSDSEEAEDIFS